MNSPASPLTPSHLDELRALLGADGVVSSNAALFTYETDALMLEKHRPDVVVLPRNSDEVAAVVRWARSLGLPITARGAGTGLAGGATPEFGGVVLSVNRMDAVLSVDAERLFAWVQPGLVNLWLSQHVAPLGLYYAPDPASQQVSTIGGNVATNAGGPHCLKYGVTLNHVLGAVVVLEDGSVVTLGGDALDSADDDLLSVVIGSEGTLGIVTEICVRLLPKPAAVRTMLFDFETIEAGCHAVSNAIAAGMVPAAMEIIDRHTVGLVEAWLHLGLPTDAAAVLLIEMDGPIEGLDAQVERIGAIAREAGARSMRVAKDDAERAAIWRGRKSAFGAYGRTASGFYIMDGVVPRTRLAEALSAIYRMAGERGLEAGNVFHAGDGNLHPHILFDADDPAARAAALEVSHEILRMCIRMGGTISGEHGVGIEKRSMMNELFAPEDLALMERLRAAFDPARALNPGKILPGGAGCGEARAAQAAFGGRDGVPAQLGGRAMSGDVEGPWI
ncbi:MAG: FAD-binding protein [Candidatus Eisenbacteria bacterium]|uniref:FAD-binding protein n=1 Tax=Eiseniibacteriota bacterium TaxID=2212470 RepID=A0A849SI12_UNCEI|nr:FAD-binding protein [Candidatus Eisenbacteria bacterium]